MEKSSQVDLFLKAIEEIFKGMDPKTFWPLNGGQIDSYFDVIEAIDMYNLLTGLVKTTPVDKIAKIMPAPDIIRLFLEHNAIIGLKVATKLGLLNLSENQRIDYLELLLDIISKKVKNNIFCLDEKNIILSEKEIEIKTASPDWDIADKNEQREIASLIVHANNLCYTLYYDIFMAGGFYIHGPYQTFNYFGRNTILLIREYHNLRPRELWPDLEISFSKIRIEGIYENLDIKINFANHPMSKSSIGDKLIAYRVYIDDKKATNAEIKKLLPELIQTSTKQSKKINLLDDLDKVRKGAEIAYYLFRNLRKSQGRDWKPPKEVENNINYFGDKFIKQFAYSEKPSLDHWKKLFDPRTLYF
ncbi:MAG: hypothetical protein AABW79_02900 [Nanoarchaeota archaeon]